MLEDEVGKNPPFAQNAKDGAPAKDAYRRNRVLTNQGNRPCSHNEHGAPAPENTIAHRLKPVPPGIGESNSADALTCVECNRKMKYSCRHLTVSSAKTYRIIRL